jgi:hypothetical protein
VRGPEGGARYSRLLRATRVQRHGPDRRRTPRVAGWFDASFRRRCYDGGATMVDFVAQRALGRECRPWQGLMLALALGGSAACEESPRSDALRQQTPEPSPNASLQPAKLTAQHELMSTERPEASTSHDDADAARAGSSPAAGPPRPWREDEALPGDSLGPRETAGATLSAQFVWFDVPGPPPVPELDAGVVRSLAQRTALKLEVDLAPAGRMRMAFLSPGFPVPERTELRTRRDAFGHLLLWPDGESYRVLPPGTLRALLGEGRADRMALVAAQPLTQGTGTWLKLTTLRSRLIGPLAELTLEQSEIAGLSSGGELLCRMLVEIAGIQPAAAGCEPELVPVRAEYQWRQGGRFAFHVISITRRHELPLSRLLVPPPGTVFRPHEYPRSATRLTVGEDLLRRLRSKDDRAPPGSAKPGAPAQGLVAINHSPLLLAMLVDGVAVAWIPPGTEVVLPSLRAGRYAVAWRDFWGTKTHSLGVLQLPGRVVEGSVGDAGAPS